MNLAQVARMLATFALFFALVQVGVLAFALGDGAPEFDSRAGFAWGAGVSAATALVLWLLGRRGAAEFYRREGLAVVALAWIAAGLLGAVPFWTSHALAAPSDAIFETISGLTTTGATVFGTGGNPPVESLPPSILLWRALLQWLGGVGVIYLFVVLLPALGVTGKNLLVSEQIGVAIENLRPNMRMQARSLFRLYLGLTVALITVYWLHGIATETQTGFDSICHAFTTLSSGGYSTKNLSLGAYDSLTIEVVTTVFMFLAGANFTLLLAVVTERSPGSLLRSPEFRVYCWVVASLIVAIALILWVSAGTISDPATRDRDYGNDLGRCLRDASFTLVSVITTTGFSNADFQNWPPAALVLLLFAMFVGGCTGSTAGGYKIVRLLVSAKLMAFTIRRFIRPRSVEKLRVDEDVLPNSVVSSILALLVLWVTAILIGTIVLSFERGLGFLSALAANMSALGCVGPAISEVVARAPGEFATLSGIDIGPYGGFGALSSWSKLFLSFQMILGRLEILPALVLFAPATWRR